MMSKNLFLLILSFSMAIAGFSQTRNAPVKNIILLIGDGMGPAQIYAGITANKGSLNIERCQYVGFHKNQATDQYVTDSGAGATAFACGVQTFNGAIGVDAHKR